MVLQPKNTKTSVTQRTVHVKWLSVNYQTAEIGYNGWLLQVLQFNWGGLHKRYNSVLLRRYSAQTETKAYSVIWSTYNHKRYCN